jgi:RNA polymerase sigma-70 factor (ECF subfamily)
MGKPFRAASRLIVQKGTWMDEERGLIARARDGDMRAFREMVETHRRFVFRLAFDLTGNFHDAEDLSQEVFVRMFRALKKFRGDCKLSSWLYTVTTNTWIELNRTRRNRFNRTMIPLEEETVESCQALHESNHDNPEHAAETSFIRDHILNALSILAPRERSVFVLRFFHDLKLAEIAEILGITEGTVKSHVFRAVKKMQKKLSFLVEERI